MISIELKDVKIFANHGVYAGEYKTGNIYEINLCVKFDEGSRTFENITSTINYEKLYEIVRQRMLDPTPLLEKLCDTILQEIKLQYPHIKEASISIYKLHAPIENFEGKVGVTLYKMFND